MMKTVRSFSTITIKLRFTIKSHIRVKKNLECFFEFEERRPLSFDFKLASSKVDE